MAANILHLQFSDSDKTYPLRGDMLVTLDFVPDETFNVTFVTYTTETFTLSSTAGNFRLVDGTISSTLVVGGYTSLFFTLMYNVVARTWDIVEHNLTSMGGSGSGFMPEVTIEPNQNGELTLDKTVSNNFNIVLTGNVKLLNPINFVPGDAIRLVVRQDSVGSRLMTFDTEYAVPNAQPPVLSTAPNAIDKIIIDISADSTYLVTTYTNAYSIVTPLARIGTTLYYKLGGPENKGAFNLIKPGETCYIIRNGKGPEATASIVGSGDSTSPKYIVAGSPVNGERPLITMLNDTRPAYGKAVLNFEANITVEVRDIRITGARNVDGDARGIAPNTSEQYITIHNVEITNCNNGVLWGNEAFSGRVDITDSMFDGNGVGVSSTGSTALAGYVHNIYAGHNNATWTAARSTFQNCHTGHNIKTRAGMAVLDQVLAFNAQAGRELNVPVGGGVKATNCIFWKTSGSIQGNLIGIGEETVDTARVREYTFRNCRFQNDVVGAGRDITFFISFDKQYPLRFVDCEFIGDFAKSLQSDPNGEYPGMVTKNGIRYWPECPPIFETTGGPLGPILPVGYALVAMTPPTDA